MWSAASRTAGARSCSYAPGSATSPPAGRTAATWTCPASVTPCRQPTETDPATGQTAFAQDFGHNQNRQVPCGRARQRGRRQGQEGRGPGERPAEKDEVPVAEGNESNLIELQLETKRSLQKQRLKTARAC